MTDVLTVPTHFGDLSELSTGLIDRVDDGRLILYGPTMFDQGAHVGFRVLLSDESTALEGYGLVTKVYDGGEGREPEIRYDTVLESLELDGRNEVVFERIVLARQSLTGEAPATGEVDISDLEDPVDEAAVSFASEAPAAFDDPMEFPADAAAAATDGQDADVIQFASPEYEAAPDHEAAEVNVLDVAPDLSPDFAATAEPDAEAFVAPVEAPEFEDVGDDVFESLPPAEVVAPIDVAPPRVALGATDGALVRPVFAASWWPRAEAPEPRPSSGWFQYTAGTLPVPPQAPRPELSPELRVVPAPRPSAEAAPPSMQTTAMEAPPVEDVVEAAVVAEADVVEAEVAAADGDVPADADLVDSDLEAAEPEAAEPEAAEPAFEDVVPEADEPSDATDASMDAVQDSVIEEDVSEPDPAGEFDEMPLPDSNTEIAPAVEAEYVSVGDATPDDALEDAALDDDAALEESFADINVEEPEAAPVDDSADVDDVDVDLDI